MGGCAPLRPEGARELCAVSAPWLEARGAREEVTVLAAAVVRAEDRCEVRRRARPASGSGRCGALPRTRAQAHALHASAHGACQSHASDAGRLQCPRRTGAAWRAAPSTRQGTLRPARGRAALRGGGSRRRPCVPDVVGEAAPEHEAERLVDALKPVLEASLKRPTRGHASSRRGFVGRRDQEVRRAVLASRNETSIRASERARGPEGLLLERQNGRRLPRCERPKADTDAVDLDGVWKLLRVAPLGAYRGSGGNDAPSLHSTPRETLSGVSRASHAIAAFAVFKEGPHLGLIRILVWVSLDSRNQATRP